jgi:quinol monooxygenase YgiN
MEIKNAFIITSIQFTSLPRTPTQRNLFFGSCATPPGVIQFQVGRSSEKPNVFALWEVYRDKAAVDAHRASEHFQRLVVNGIRPLAQQRNVETAVPI